MPIEISELGATNALMYLVFSLNAKLNIHTEMLADILENVSAKDNDEIKREYYTKVVKELKAVRNKFVEDESMLQFINTITKTKS